MLWTRRFCFRFPLLQYFVSRESSNEVYSFILIILHIHPFTHTYVVKYKNTFLSRLSKPFPEREREREREIQRVKLNMEGGDEEVVVENTVDKEEVEVDAKEEEEGAEESLSPPKEEEQQRREYPSNKVVSATMVDYEGDRDEKRDTAHGVGKATFMGGNVFEGKFEDNVMQGEGVYMFHDGSSFRGTFCRNRIEGKGTLEWPDGNKYEGDVKNGKPHGDGIFYFSNSNASYEGSFKNGLRDGNGKLFYDLEKKTRYEGSWCKGERNGFGLMVYATGNTYKGMWKDGKKHGRGLMVWSDRGEMYDGEWKNGLQNGIGVHTWMGETLSKKEEKLSRISNLMRNRYEGNFKDGTRHGFGVFFYANGSRYEGQWNSNVKQGRGVFTFSDGHILRGEFQSDRIAQPKSPTRSSSTSRAKTSATNSSTRKRRDRGWSHQTTLYIHDLLNKNPVTAPSEMRAIRRTLMKWNSELQDYYTCVTAEEDSNGEFAMTLAEFWRFLHVVRIPPLKLTSARIDRMILKMRLEYYQAKISNEKKQDDDDDVRANIESAQSPLMSSKNVHDPSDRLLFREFVEVLVRIANEYDFGGEEEEKTNKLSVKVSNLIENVIMSPISRARMGFEIVPVSMLTQSLIPSFDHMIDLPSIRDSLSRHEMKLREVFDLHSSSKPHYLSAKVDDTMSIREWIVFLSDADIVSCEKEDGGSSMTPKQAALVALRSCFVEDDYKNLSPGDLSVELTFGDFLRCIAGMSYEDVDCVGKSEKCDDEKVVEEKVDVKCEEKVDENVDEKIDEKCEEKIDENCDDGKIEEEKVEKTEKELTTTVEERVKKTQIQRPSSTRSSPPKRSLSSRQSSRNTMTRPSTTKTSVDGLLYDLKTSEEAQNRERFSELEKEIATKMIDSLNGYVDLFTTTK